MGSLVHRFFSALLIFTVISMEVGCCFEISDISEQFENSGQASYSVESLDKSQDKFERASVSAEKKTLPDTDCQGAGGCVQCRTGCCHLLMPVLSNLVSSSVDPVSFEETQSAIYLSRNLSGPKEPPKV